MDFSCCINFDEDQNTEIIPKNPLNKKNETHYIEKNQSCYLGEIYSSQLIHLPVYRRRKKDNRGGSSTGFYDFEGNRVALDSIMQTRDKRDQFDAKRKKVNFRRIGRPRVRMRSMSWVENEEQESGSNKKEKIGKKETAHSQRANISGLHRGKNRPDIRIGGIVKNFRYKGKSRVKEV